MGCPAEYPGYERSLRALRRQRTFYRRRAAYPGLPFRLLRPQHRHNHPYIVQALKDELDKSGPAMLQSHVPEIAGELAKRLCQLAGGGLEKVYFGSSGSEGVEAAIKFARAATSRAGIVYAKSSFHGLTAGALSLMNDAFWREGFGPLLQDTVGVDYGDGIALEGALQGKRHAALVLEPVQAEAGIRVPSKQYLQKAQELCLRTGTLFVIDEVQTGMFRTGTFLASHQFELRPDIVILAKALSGGLMPVSAVLMTDKIYHAVYSSLRRAIVHTSTFSENSLSMRAGLASLDVLESQQLGRGQWNSAKHSAPNCATNWRHSKW